MVALIASLSSRRHLKVSSTKLNDHEQMRTFQIDYLAAGHLFLFSRGTWCQCPFSLISNDHRPISLSRPTSVCFCQPRCGHVFVQDIPKLVFRTSGELHIAFSTGHVQTIWLRGEVSTLTLYPSKAMDDCRSSDRATIMKEAYLILRARSATLDKQKTKQTLLAPPPEPFSFWLR